jgi:hypothetical protein
MDAEREGRADSPSTVYAARLRDRQTQLEQRARRVAALSNARLAAFSLLVAAAVAVWLDALSGPWLLLPGGAFLILVPLHRRAARRARGSAPPGPSRSTSAAESGSSTDSRAGA